MHGGLHFKLETHVQVGDAFSDYRALGGRHRSGADDRHSLADVNTCLLAVADADHRAGQGIDVLVLGIDLGLRCRRDADAAGVDAPQLVEHADRFAVGSQHAERVGPLQAKVEDA
ncbi:hypothetical protein D3C80_1799930 [compost metagenome]